MLEGLNPPLKPITTCKVKLIASELSEKDRLILYQAIKDHRWSAKALALALKERGVYISDTTLLRHRRKECNCE